MDYSKMPKYRWGQPIVAATDLMNDGSFPDREEDVLLVAQGAPGEVVQVGQHVESGVLVYMVQFRDGAVVGCREEELAPA